MTIFDLEHPRTPDMPLHPAHRPGYSYFLHRRHSDTAPLQPGPTQRSSASGFITMTEHSGTHVDALCHQAEDLAFYGCGSVDDVESAAGFSQGDASRIPIFDHPGVLIDIAVFRGVSVVPAGERIGLDEVRAALERQGTEVTAGSVVLVHTGNTVNWADADRYLAGAGMDAEVSQWLADRGVAAVGADNVAWDLPGYVDETVGSDLPGHVILLVRAGIHIFENVALTELARAGVHEFRFVAAPLKLMGATGSPIRPLALVEQPTRR